MRRLHAVAVVSATFGLAACASTPPPPPPPRPVALAPAPKPDPGDPLEVEVVAKRTGNALYLDLVGRARRHPEGRPFEDPARWRIRARSGDQVLDRVVNGPVEIEREPIDREGDRYNVQVRFSVAFAMPEDASTVEIQVAAPFGVPYGRTFEGLVAPKPTSVNGPSRRSKRKQPQRQGRRAPRS